MKLHHLISVTAVVVLALVPLSAEAKKKHGARKPASSNDLYINLLNQCRKQYGNGYDVQLYKQNGRWICEYRGN